MEKHDWFRGVVEGRDEHGRGKKPARDATASQCELVARISSWYCTACGALLFRALFTDNNTASADREGRVIAELQGYDKLFFFLHR